MALAVGKAFGAVCGGVSCTLTEEHGLHTIFSADRETLSTVLLMIGTPKSEFKQSTA